ncbi:MAG: HAD family hydrolase [Candidatus Odinarchaeia archaeon]
MKVCVWDLEGPLSFVDFAAEIFKILESKLNRGNLDKFYQMISNYDDYLIENPHILRELKVESYEPGDTLRLLAPFYVYFFTDEELREISRRRLGIIPGAKDLFSLLKRDWEIFIISTSYVQHAYNVAEELGVPTDHVYCTEFPIDVLKEELPSIEESVEILIDTIFEKYKKRGLEAVIPDLNEFFFKGKETSYRKVMNKVIVRGGRRKEDAVKEISERVNCPISEMIAVGDSITDMNMLGRVDAEGGIAITFNGNQYCIRYANIAVTAPDQMGSLPIFQSYPKVFEFVDEWSSLYPSLKDDPTRIPEDLISDIARNYYIEKNFVPRIDNLKNASESKRSEVLRYQLEMRKKVRGWFGELG